MKTSVTRLIALFGMILPAMVSGQATCTWTGNENETWNEPLNWVSGQVPSTGDHVIINAGTYQPVLGQNHTTGNLTISPGASLTADGVNLYIKGNWNNSGTFYAGYGQVVFNGSSHQTISGNQTFYILEINNEAGAEILSGSDTITGVLKVTYGGFFTNDSLVLYSDPNGTGSIGPLTSGSLTGKITMMRHMNVLADDWRFLSSPVADFTFEQINDNIWTSGFTGSTYPGESFISVYAYDETVSGTADYGYVSPENITDTLQTGLGFMVYIGTGSISSTIDFTGTPNQGSIDIPVYYTLTDTFSDGWNLIGNPYPSAISWKDAGNTKINMDNAIYTWNSEQGVYASYVDGIGANGGSDVIAAGQAFYVKANSANPQLTLSETAKRANQDTYMKSEETVLYLTMKVENSYGYDETVFRPNADATNSFDSWADAEKMFSYNWMIPSVYSTDDQDYYYSINQFAPVASEIPIYVNTGSSEMHEITFTGIEAFEASGCVFLEDLHTGMVYDLRTTHSISLFVADTTYAPRFILKTGAPYMVEATDATCNGEYNGSIQVAKQSATPFSVSLSDEDGAVLATETAVYEILNLDNLGAGLYVVESTDELCGVQTDTLLITQPDAITADFSLSADTLYLPVDDSWISFENNSENAEYYSWEFGNGESSTDVNPAADFSQSGHYTVTLVAYQNATCFSSIGKDLVVISSLGLENVASNQPQTYVQNGQIVVKAEGANQIEIYDLNGRLLHRQNAEGPLTLIRADITANQYYLVQVISDNGIFAQKLFFTY